ncbi:MAG: S8 family serine peptidase [Bryobacteraceae bacterium]
MKHRVCGCLLVLTSFVCPALAEDSSEKIDPKLWALLSTDGSKVPAFVLFAGRAPLGPASRIPERAARGKAVIKALISFAENSQIAVRAQLSAQGVPFTPYWVTNAIFLPEATAPLVLDLAKRPEITGIFAEPEYSVPDIAGAQQTTISGGEWNVSKINADEVWSVATGTGIVVGSIDTGVRYTHEALVNQYRGNSGGSFDHKGNWYDPTGRCGATPCDNTSHGTHVMGILVGSDGGTNFTGVAPGAKWISCKGCTDNSTCLGSKLLACAQWMMDPLGDGTGAGQPDIVNNSWGGASGDAWFMSYVDSWRSAGIFPVFSAGNNGPGCATTGSPGDYPGSFAAGATDSYDVIASFSSRGPSGFFGTKPNVTAPGVNIRSSAASGDTSYGYYSGTSMASPHVAGVVALLWSARPELYAKIALTEKVLRLSAVPMSTSENCGGSAQLIPNNTYGSGRVDAASAVGTSVTPDEPPLVTISSPPSGTSVKCPAAVPLAGTASDVEGGDLTSSIVWASDGAVFAEGGSATRTFSCAEVGTHNLVAGITDQGGLIDTDTVTIQVQAACKVSGAACSSNRECCSSKCGGKSVKLCK